MRDTLKLAALCGLAIFGLGGLSGCGFAPLYAQQGLTLNLSQVAVEVPQTRTGYFLEQDLRNGLGNDAGSDKIYNLKVDIKENHYAIGFKVDDTSTRSEITNSVNYTLTDISNGQILDQGQFTDTVTYDSSKSPFTGVISQQDAQKRAATSISQKIQTQLALYFHNKP